MRSQVDQFSSCTFVEHPASTASITWAHRKTLHQCKRFSSGSNYPPAGMRLRAALMMQCTAPLTGRTRVWTRCARPAATSTGMLTARARSERRARTPWNPPRTPPSRRSGLLACLSHAACLLCISFHMAHVELDRAVEDMLCYSPHLRLGIQLAAACPPPHCHRIILKGDNLQGHCCGWPELHRRASVSASIRR